jgi:CheY-like chemotaxis protein
MSPPFSRSEPPVDRRIVESNSSKRVLVIEDYPDSAQVLCLALQAQGHTVELAATGADGIQKARTFRPDVIVCDLALPDLDGLGVARVVRSDPRLWSTWLIALSVYYLPAHASEAGFDEYLTKPADLQQLAIHLQGEPPSRPELSIGT